MKIFNTFLKGFLMGSADIIPGISGGTIAFITGIYFRFINSVKNVNLKNIISLVRSLIGFEFKDFLKKFAKLDFHFLFFLLLGILTAVLSISRLITYLLDNFTSYTLAFFVGLILASSKIIFDEIQSHKVSDLFFGVLGLAIGITMLFLVPQNVSEPALWYVFLGGFIAVFAMFLPGISGSFILLILDLYYFILESLKSISTILERISYLLSFVIGLIFGAFFISRLISFAYEKSKSKTLYILLGVVLGALAIPIRDSISNIVTPNAISYLILLGFVVEGILVVLLINVLSKN